MSSLHIRSPNKAAQRIRTHVMKMKDITPANFVCHTSTCCPAVLETEEGTYVIIGKKLSDSALKAVEGRVAEDEFVIEVPKGMIDEIKKAA